jgi:hypothetical protein
MAKWTAEQRAQFVYELAAKDGLVCFYCEHWLLDPLARHVSDRAEWYPTIDHLRPVSDWTAGRKEIRNMVLACKACNHKKGVGAFLLAETIRMVRRRLRQQAEVVEKQSKLIDHLRRELSEARRRDPDRDYTLRALVESRTRSG